MTIHPNTRRAAIRRMQTRLTDPVLTDRIAKVSHGNEDCAAHVRLSLLEAAARDPKFADQQVGYLITKAKWSALNYFDHERVDQRHVVEEPVFVNDEGEELSAFDELIPASLPSPEEIVEYHEAAARLDAAIATLPQDQRKIARLLAQGFDTPAIAAKIGKSTSNVCHITARLRANLSAALAV
jgi:RNA polymerase sigma factor (sigma-70 family)